MNNQPVNLMHFWDEKKQPGYFFGEVRFILEIEAYFPLVSMTMRR